jgi:hypothetical protein
MTYEQYLHMREDRRRAAGLIDVRLEQQQELMEKAGAANNKNAAAMANGLAFAHKIKEKATQQAAQAAQKLAQGANRSDKLIKAGKTAAVGSTVAQEVWNLSARERGLLIEKALGGNLPDGFFIIDKWDEATGTGTSIKSIDLNADTYKSAAAVGNLARAYVDMLASFAGEDWGDMYVDPAKVGNRELEVAIPPGANAAQLAALFAVKHYAALQGIAMRIYEFVDTANFREIE